MNNLYCQGKTMNMSLTPRELLQNLSDSNANEYNCPVLKLNLSHSALKQTCLLVFPTHAVHSSNLVGISVTDAT